MDTGSKDYLTFRLARRDLAIDSARVRGILPLTEMMPVPGSNRSILGVVNFSGRPIVVIDLRHRLRLAAASHGAQPKIIVVEASGSHLAGFVADRAANIVRYRARDLRDGMLYGSGRRRHLIDIDEVVSKNDLVRLWTWPGD